MSLPVLMKALRQLSYSEMMKLSEELQYQMTGHKAEANKTNAIAKVLAELDFPEAEVAQTDELKYLKQAFTRKRSIAVKYDKGFYVSCDSLPGSQVVGVDLRVAFGQMTDQIVTMQALQNMK